MIGVAILKTDGTAVTLGIKFTEPKFDSNGFIIGFIYENSNYKYYQNGDFEYRKKDKDLSGYYKEIEFHLYVSLLTLGNIPDVKMKFLRKFIFTDYESKVEESIIVKVVDFGEPYNYYYKELIYSFSLELDIVTNKVRKYKKAVFDSYELVGYEIDISTSIIPVENSIPLMNQPTGYFFSRNFGEFANAWQISETAKRTYKKMTTLMAYKINYIYEDVLTHIIASTSLAKIIAASFSTNTNPIINELSKLERLVFNLQRSWGYFYNPLEDPIYIYRTTIDPIFTQQSNFYDYSGYYNGLVQFYFNTYRNRVNLKQASDDEKFKLLLGILPLSALRIFSYSDIKAALIDYIVKGRFNEREEEFVVRLILSINKSDADEFLDFLLQANNGSTSNYEVIYNLLDDARLERYPIVSWFVDEQTNKKYYVYAIYELWKVSKYNWNYFSDGLSHSPEAINPDSYFVEHFTTEYNQNNVLEFLVPFGTTETGGLIELVGPTKYFTRLISGKINITSRTSITRISKDGVKANDEFDFKTNEVGDFHFYHPMNLTGYKPNLELEFPQKSVIPAFLYHYAEEYDELADFDAGIALTINVGIDIALFFAFGGGSILNDLKYLKELTEIGQAIRNTLPATKAITVWRASESAAEIVTVTAGVIASYQTYLADKANDPATQKHHLAIQRWMLGLMLLTATGTVYARTKAVSEAGSILQMMSKFPEGTHGVPANIKNLLETLAGKQAVFGANLETKLKAINEGGIIDNVIEKFKQLDDREKYLFFDDFGDLSIAEWVFLDAKANKYINNWLLLKNKNIIEARNIRIISDQHLVDGFLRYYDGGDAVRKILEGLNVVKRVKFIRDFATQPLEWFNHIKADPAAIGRWGNLDNYGKLFAKQNSDIWLYRFDRLYQNLPKWSRIPDAEILQRFGQEGLDLVIEVEIFALNHISNASKTQLLKNDILISGIKDTNDNITSGLYTNFSKAEIRNGEYQTYLDNMFPNLKSRIDEIIAFNKENYRMADIEYLKNTGDYPGAHAEIRALDDLAKTKFGNNLPTNEEFDAWLKNDLLGYNRNIQHGVGQQNIGMHTCADCFHITYLITFIKP